MNLLKYALFIIFAAFFVSLNAWTDYGHQMTADIAQHYLSSKAKFEISKILTETNGKMAPVSTWADTIKKNPKYSFSSVLHYSNTPGTCEHDMKRDCPTLNCVVGAVSNYTNLLIQRNQHNPADVKDFLKFLIHFIGDISCPMHIGWAKDRGGNDIKVKFFGQSASLHFVWDHLIILKHMNDNFKGKQELLLNSLLDKLKGEMKGKIKEWTSCREAGQVICPNEWATETAQVSCDPGYKNVKNGDNLEHEYYTKSVPHVETQIMKGGIRLAHTLNWIFERSM
jgi:hypothetical protein